MKRKMSPRKKYANGTNIAGVGPNNYIQSPNEVLNDYNIMLAKADQEVASNSVVPIVSLIGGLTQQAMTSGVFNKTPATAANGMNNVNQDVEVEGGEMYETPQGQTGEFQGPTHEQGGMPMEVGEDIPEGTKVYSDRLKVGKETLAERKEVRERKIANLEKIAAQPLVDSAVKNATQRKMQAIQKEEMADLQFQEQVNNMQQMADNVIAAFGTSMEGVQSNPVGDSMRYGMGTGADGVTEYADGGVIKKPWEYLRGDANLNGLTDKLENNPNINLDALTNFKIGEGINDNASLDYGDPYAKDGVNFEMPTNTVMTPVDQYGNGVETDLPGNKVTRALSKMGGMPGIGDMTSLFGDYLGATSGLKNAAEQRSTDITHRNVYANAGKESQKQLDNAMSSIENAKTQAIVKATTTTQGGKKSGRNSARGVNQMRGMDWLYDTALNQQVAEISANAANQVSDIFKTKASTALSTDQLKGQGEQQANMANEAAKDAYYTAKGLGLKDQALGVQNIGKDLNSMKQNKMIENLMKDYGKYVSVDKTGKMTNKNKATKTTDNVEMPDGKGGTISMTKAEFQKLMEKVTNTK